MTINVETASIFVSIASYRDQFLPGTIRAALEKAAHPERLTFGICWQGTIVKPGTCDQNHGYHYGHT